jgi:hypothetical protein
MSEIDRCLITVRPKQPLLDWLRTLDDDRKDIDDPEAIQFDNTAYLVPEYGDDKELQEILEEFYPYIFENELESWDPTETAWPQNRNLKMFLEWFDVEFHSVVYDLAEGLPMQGEDYIEESDYDSGDFD